MSSLFDVREALLERKPTYKAVFASGSPVTFASHRVRVHEVDILDALTVDEFFSIDEFKAYPDDGFFPFVNRSPLGDMFAFSDRWILANTGTYFDLALSHNPSIYLRFGESMGTAAEDHSGNGHVGTYQNSPTLGTAGGLASDLDTAVTLNAVNQHITVPDHALLDPGNTFTIAFRMKPASHQNSGYLVSKGANGYAVLTGTFNGRIKLWKEDVGEIAESTAATPIGVWSDVVITKAGATTRIYINGVNVTGTVTDRTIVGTATQLNIGRYWGASNYFNGSLDEFLIYPTALSAADVLALYAVGQAVTPYAATIEPPATTTPMQIIPEQGRCSVGAVQLTIEDVDGEATAVMSGNIQGQNVDIYGGFHDFDEDDYQFLYRGSVQSVQLDGDLVRYRVQVHDPLTRVNRKLFSGAASTLNSAITASTVTFSVPIAGISFFQDSGYLLIDNEILYFGDREFTQFVFVERGMFNDTGARPATAHAAGATVKEIFPLGPAHPIDILLGIYYGTPSKSCLGFGYNDLDWMAFQRARDILGASYQMQFFLIAEENALEFMSRELHKVIGAYPFITADGRISIKVFEPAGAAVATFDHQSILESGGRVEMGWTFGQGVLGQVINDVSINYNIDPTTGKNYSFYRDTRATSITNHDRFPVVFNSAGLRMELAGTEAFIEARVDAILDRYENGCPVITISTHLQKQSIDVGDIVSLTSHLIPNRQTGARGVTAAKAEVINRSIHWDTGRVQFTLLGLDAQL